MNIIALILFILMSILNIVACNKKLKNLIIFSKVTLAPLAFLNVLLNTSFNKNIILLIGLCYTFYLIGDIFLLSNKTKFFISGLISFLLGHLSFIILFLIFKRSTIILFIFLILLIYPEFIMLKVTKRGGQLKVPMRIYSVFLITFIAVSSTTLNIFFIIATSIFTLSDSLIATNSCYKEKKFGDTIIMATYTLALILLSNGLIYLGGLI